MQIGDMRQFLQNQQSKVQRRKEEEKQTKKAVYQMQALIEGQCMETLEKETDRSRERVKLTQEKGQGKDSRNQNGKKTDANTEMQKMLSMAGRFAGMKI